MTLPVGAGAVYHPGLMLLVGSDGRLRGARMFVFTTRLLLTPTLDVFCAGTVEHIWQRCQAPHLLCRQYEAMIFDLHASASRDACCADRTHVAVGSACARGMT